MDSGYGASVTGFLVVLVAGLHFFNGERLEALRHSSRVTPHTSHLTGQHYLAEAVTNNAIFCAKERIGAEYAAASSRTVFL